VASGQADLCGTSTWSCLREVWPRGVRPGVSDSATGSHHAGHAMDGLQRPAERDPWQDLGRLARLRAHRAVTPTDRSQPRGRGSRPHPVARGASAVTNVPTGRVLPVSPVQSTASTPECLLRGVVDDVFVHFFGQLMDRSVGKFRQSNQSEAGRATVGLPHLAWHLGTPSVCARAREQGHSSSAHEG
jgi:hypothetical protein